MTRTAPSTATALRAQSRLDPELAPRSFSGPLSGLVADHGSCPSAHRSGASIMTKNPIASSPWPSRRSVAGLAMLAAASVIAGCTGGSPGDRDNRGQFVLNSISTGSGTIFPYRIRQADQFGNPTTTVLNIEGPDAVAE